MLPPKKEQICALITTYRPKDSIISNVQTILHQVGEVIIVDDGAIEDNVEKLTEWFRNVSKVTIWHQPANSGIAAALNIGIKIAKQKHYQWVLTLDDDSLPDLDVVDRLCKCLYLINGSCPVGVIGMRWTSKYHLSSKYNRTSAPVKYLAKRGIITSGSMFSIKNYDIVGPFREEFFIDAVDYDFCMRARRKGFHIIQIQDYGFIHELGISHKYKFGLFKFSIYSHSPIRLYYAFRNFSILAREYIFQDPLFTCAVIVTHLKTVIKVLLLEAEKRKKCIAMARGLIDAVRLNTGKSNLFNN